ncbi:MAG: response regulator [Bryobacteraceae bacterium]|nr:response regulator [Bryobacteraceae bacterium]
MRKPATPPANNLRLLVVDDNSRGLLARKVVLEEQGYQVTTCCTPEEALALFETSPFDIVVTDYRMPNINGVELLERLRSIRPVPVVLMSGMVEVLGLNEGNTGADAVVTKNSHEIVNMLRAVNRLATKPPKKSPGPQGSGPKRKKASGE